MNPIKNFMNDKHSYITDYLICECYIVIKFVSLCATNLTNLFVEILKTNMDGPKPLKTI